MNLNEPDWERACKNESNERAKNQRIVNRLHTSLRKLRYMCEKTNETAMLKVIDEAIGGKG